MHAAADEGFALSGRLWISSFPTRATYALQAQQHKVEVRAALRHERQTLAERMQDDYGIEMSAEVAAEQGRFRRRSRVEQEIAQS